MAASKRKKKVKAKGKGRVRAAQGGKAKKTDLIGLLSGLNRGDLETAGVNRAGLAGPNDPLQVIAGGDVSSRPDLGVHQLFNERAFQKLEPILGPATGTFLRALGAGKEGLDELRDNIGFLQGKGLGGGADQYQVSEEFGVSEGEMKGDDTTEAVPQKGERPHLQRFRQGV